MGKEEKMVQRLLSLPADYSYSEARALALRFGYIEQNKGSTSGSRVMFFRPYDKRKILLHKPHPGDIMKKLCDISCLSQSRLSHLFTQNMGMSLHRYLSFDKMRKGYTNFLSTGNITQAALDSGFDTPSHFAATCKRMFGLSFSEFQKSTQK